VLLGGALEVGGEVLDGVLDGVRDGAGDLLDVGALEVGCGALDVGRGVVLLGRPDEDELVGEPLAECRLPGEPFDPPGTNAWWPEPAVDWSSTGTACLRPGFEDELDGAPALELGCERGAGPGPGPGLPEVGLKTNQPAPPMISRKQAAATSIPTM
jgi:hypothetical protein